MGYFSLCKEASSESPTEEGPFSKRRCPALPTQAPTRGTHSTPPFYPFLNGPGVFVEQEALCPKKPAEGVSLAGSGSGNSMCPAASRTLWMECPVLTAAAD